MKKIILAVFLVSSTLFATANSKVKATTKTALFIKKTIKGKPVYEIRFSCDGGTTWGTVCCFNSTAEAQAFIDSGAINEFCQSV
jgi:hypothetical protein